MTERKRAVKNMAGEERFDLEVLLKWIKTEILFENFDSEALQGHAEVNQYFKYCIESIFKVLDWINIRSIGLNQFSKYWIESVFEVLD